MLPLLTRSTRVSTLRAPMRNAIRARKGQFLAADFSPPSGGTWRWATRGVGADVGHYAPSLISLALPERSLPMDTPTVSLTGAALDVSDTDVDSSGSVILGPIAREISSRLRGMRRAGVTIYHGAETVAQADWEIVFSGILTSISRQEPSTIRMTFQGDDLALKSQIPKIALVDSAWPNIDATAKDAAGPIVYGIHDSDGVTSTGALRCDYVDTVLFDYLISTGRIKAIRAAYADDVRADTSTWSLQYVDRGGVTWSVVRFTSDQGDAKVTVDVEGLTERADGTGDVIENPALQMEHLLANFVFSDWRGALDGTVSGWERPSTHPIDVDSVGRAAEYCEMKGYRGSRKIGPSRVAVQRELETWARSFDLRVYWTPESSLAMAPAIDHTYHAMADLDVLDRVVGADDELALPADVANTAIRRRLDVSYLAIEAAGGFQQNLSIEDLGIPEESSDTMSLEWSLSSGVD